MTASPLPSSQWLRLSKQQSPPWQHIPGFFDDANAVGTLAELSQVVDIVRREGPALGILLNNDKSSIWSPLALGPGEKDPLQL